MSEELKPCPFCGSTRVTFGIKDVCVCISEGCPLSMKSMSRNDWNTRPIEDAQDKRIKELEDALERSQKVLDFVGKLCLNALQSVFRRISKEVNAACSMSSEIDAVLDGIERLKPPMPEAVRTWYELDQYKATEQQENRVNNALCSWIEQTFDMEESNGL